MPRVRTLSTTCLALLSFALLGVAAAAAAGGTPPAAETPPQEFPFTVDLATTGPAAGPAESTGAAGLDDNAVPASTLCPLPQFHEAAFSRKPTCAEAEAKCASKALNKVVCDYPSEVCLGPDVFIDSCIQKPAGDFRADCHVEWRCSVEI
ncbi:MAG TPA: hypothetical protein VGG06_07580 [Thermoanaerobaculia bacterium]|jgi:hypothetical protein